ncbi:hypothetical protein [Aeromonas sanarellii]|uniref:hypothetical protein n=1 Tax=Aeromonas sanarellii TaxID=633415 RepID=UPI003B9E6243
MWNSAAVRQSASDNVTHQAGVAVFKTHMNISTLPCSYVVIHDQSVSNYFNSGWSSYSAPRVDLHVDQPLVGIADIILNVKEVLGLPNKDVASIFGVTRQTLHSYVTEEGVSQFIKTNTRERVFTLHEIIKEVSPLFTQSPGAMSKNFIVDGSSLLDLFKAEKLDIVKILSHSRSLAEKMSKIPSSTSRDDNTLFGLTRNV